MFQKDLKDEELMTFYQNGSEDAFKELYSRHSGKVLGYLRSRAKSDELIADLFQEVFVKMHKSKHQYNKSQPFLPWVFSITHSVLIDVFRKVERKKEVFVFDFDQLQSDSELQISEKEINSLDSVLSPLTKNQQEVLQMRYVEEKTFEEIAKQLKTTPLNVRQIISRAIRKIKNFVNEGGKS
jgi:RNA polymerase sigma-70 factor, ECF subfamily